MASDGFDISSFMLEASKQSKLISESVGKLTAMAADSTAAADQLVESILGGTDKNGDTRISKEAKLTGELQLQNRKQEFYAAVGMDANGQAKISNKLASEYNALMEQANNQMAGIVEKKQVGLFDNPIDYLINAITLPDEINAMKATQAAAQLKSTQLDTVNKLAQETAQTENMFKLTTSQAAVDSQLQGFQNDINAQAAQAKIQAINSNAHTVVTVMEAQGKQLQNIKSVVDMRNSQQYLAMAQEASRQAKVRFNEWVEDTSDKKMAEEQMLTYYNEGAASAGRLPLDVPKFKLLMASGLDKEATKAYIEAGFMRKSFGSNALGISPSGVAEFLGATKNSIPEKDTYAATIFKQASELNGKMEQAGKLDKKNPQAVQGQFDENVKVISKELQTNIKYSDKENPYLIPPPAAWADKAPDVAASPLYQKVIAAQKIDTSDPQRIFMAGKEAVLAGQITPREWVSGMQLYYDKGTEVNNAGRQFRKYAIPEATSHKVTIKVPAGFAGTASDALSSWNPFSRTTDIKIDMRNEAELNRIAASVLGAEAMLQFNTKNLFGVGADAVGPAFKRKGE